MVNDPARSRLLSLADQSGASLSALSRLIGRNASYLQQFVRKGSPRKLEEDDRRTLARFFGVDESELRDPGGQENSFGPARRSPAASPAGEWIDVPRLSLGASAGPGATGAEAEVGHLGFSIGWLRELGLQREGLAALTVTGDSMEPTLRDGDEILVTRLSSRASDGIHVLRRDDALMVKRLQFTAPVRVSIISDNRAYPPVEDVPLAEIEVLGRVVWKGGRI